MPQNDKNTNQEKEKQKEPVKQAENIKSKSGIDETIISAHKQAEEDIQNDPDMSPGTPNDDLDEGETARLGDGKTTAI